MPTRIRARFLAASLFITLLAPISGFPAWAADCGDRAGAGGTRVACACGDTVITTTALKAGDPVVTTPCPGVGLHIGADHVTLNCSGRQITGAPGEAGIQLVERTGVTVRGCAIAGFTRGLGLLESSGNTLLSNTVTHAVVGIVLEGGSDDNVVRSNRVVGPVIDAINLLDANRNVIVSNTLDGVRDS